MAGHTVIADTIGECGCCDPVEACSCTCCYPNFYGAGIYWSMDVTFGTLSDVGSPPIPASTYSGNTFTLTRRDDECVWETADKRIRVITGTSLATLYFYDNTGDADNAWICSSPIDWPIYFDSTWCRNEGNTNASEDLTGDAFLVAAGGETDYYSGPIASFQPTSGSDWYACSDTTVAADPECTLAQLEAVDT